MGRAPCCDKASVKKGPWSPEEDAKLKDFIEKHGTGGNWIALPHKAGLKRCGKSCRLRWLNYLRPNIKHGEFSEDEDRIICSLYASIGSRWSVIASQLPGRTDNDIKNYWNTKLKKKLLTMLPCIQKKPSFSPCINVQSPPLSDLHKQDGFLNNASSSFHNYNPNFMNVNNTINSLILSTTTTINNNHVQFHSDATDLFTQPASTALIGMISDEKNYYGFQNHNMNKEKERMLMFGDQNHGVMTYNKDDDHRIKQEHQYAINVFENQTNGVMTDHKYFDQKQKGCFKNLEEVKQVIGINNNSGGISSSSINVDINGYLMNDDDENKTTHNITDGFYRMIDGSN